MKPKTFDEKNTIPPLFQPRRIYLYKGTTRTTVVAGSQQARAINNATHLLILASRILLLPVRSHLRSLLPTLLRLVLLLLLLLRVGGRRRSKPRLLAGRPGLWRLAPAVRLEAARGRWRRGTAAVERSGRWRSAVHSGWHLRRGLGGRGTGGSRSGLGDAIDKVMGGGEGRGEEVQIRGTETGNYTML